MQNMLDLTLIIWPWFINDKFDNKLFMNKAMVKIIEMKALEEWDSIPVKRAKSGKKN